jgi:hypothetical protein
MSAAALLPPYRHIALLPRYKAKDRLPLRHHRLCPLVYLNTSIEAETQLVKLASVRILPRAQQAGRPDCASMAGLGLHAEQWEGIITEGLNVFRFSGCATDRALELDVLNPQTQEFTLP